MQFAIRGIDERCPGRCVVDSYRLKEALSFPPVQILLFSPLPLFPEESFFLPIERLGYECDETGRVPDTLPDDLLELHTWFQTAFVHPCVDSCSFQLVSNSPHCFPIFVGITEEHRTTLDWRWF